MGSNQGEVPTPQGGQAPANPSPQAIAQRRIYETFGRMLRELTTKNQNLQAELRASQERHAAQVGLLEKHIGDVEAENRLVRADNCKLRGETHFWITSDRRLIPFAMNPAIDWQMRSLQPGTGGYGEQQSRMEGVAGRVLPPENVDAGVVPFEVNSAANVLPVVVKMTAQELGNPVGVPAVDTVPAATNAGGSASTTKVTGGAGVGGADVVIIDDGDNDNEERAPKRQRRRRSEMTWLAPAANPALRTAIGSLPKPFASSPSPPASAAATATTSTETEEDMVASFVEAWGDDEPAAVAAAAATKTDEPEETDEAMEASFLELWG